MKTKFFNAVCKTRYLALLVVLIFTCGNAWGTYTITFNGSNSDQTSISTSTTAASITGSSTYVTGNVATATKVYGATSDGIKLGARSSAGTIKINLSASGQVTPTSIVVNCKLYNSSNSATLKVNGSATQSVPSTSGNLTFNITSAITYIQLESSKYIWVKSVTVNTAAAGTSVTASPSSITFDEVTLDPEEGAEGSKNVTISLTNGNVGYPGGGSCYLNGWVETDETDCEFYVNSDYTYQKATSTTSETLSLSYYATDAGTFTGDFIIQGFNSSHVAVNCTIPLSVTVDPPACANSVTINKGTQTNCIFTLSKSGAQASCSGVSTTVTVTPNTGYGNPSVTQSGASAAPTITGSGNSWTVSYGNNTTGTSTINVSCSANNYTITLDKDLTPTTAGTASIAVTYNSNTNLTSAITKPTKTGWTFGGYFTAKNGGGTQIIDASGNVIASAGGGSTYTDASKNWKYAGNITLYAKWTCTVTWSVNGATNVYPAQTVTYNSSGSKVTSVPTPDPASYCGQVFAGWTTAEYSGNSAPSPLYKTASEFPNATGDQTFYAVFATASGGGGAEWVETTIGDLTGSDIFVLATPAGYAVSNNNGTSSAPTAISITVSEGKITSSVTDAMKWNLGGNSTDGYIFYPNGTTTTWLYCNTTASSSSNNNIRVGTGDRKYWIADEDGDYVTNDTYTDRWLCNYNNADFRGYIGSSVTSDIVSKFYKYSAGTTYSAYSTTCGATYTITLAGSPAGTVTGGTFSASASSASQGTVITLTANPTRGYEFGSWTVTDASSNPVSVSNNQFTMPASNVTVSATFNTATPLTITLNTNSKGTFTTPTEFPIYAGETFTFPDVTPSDPSCATFVGWIAGTTFEGDGTTHDAPVTIAANTVSDPQNSDATYTAVFYETETTESDAYVKVTSAPANWANDHYLIVYEGDATHAAVAFDGKRDNGDNGDIDAASNTVAVSITSSAIAATNALAASEWKIALISGSNYSIQSASGKYIGNASNSNALSTNSSALANTLSISGEDFEVVSAGGAYLRYNANSGQERFRYYKSSTYTSQEAIQLYKLGTAVVETQTYTTNPACTPKYRVTVASVTGGSPNADPRYNPESTEVSLTANPSAGYAFTSWTITKTTGGDNVTTTLLPGAKATTANTTFSMPAYDVTVTAGYAKIVVSELKVMDGSTVVANTTGSVSGTVNVSTGANKTLDVVITPADAFDHSWTATVTAGGTNASISNVTDAGFRVNGLAQGDATVTVTAPNDGNAKVVTFTVHVTDILPEEIILKRDGSDAPIDALTMYYDAANSRGQYVKVNVSFTPTPTNKDFSVSADGTFVTIHAQAHTNPNYYATLNGNKVTTSPVNVTFTSAATSSVTKNLVVTVLPCPADQFVDYIHGNATVTRAAQVSADHWSINTSITTPTLSDKPESSSADCEAGHYHLIGWLPQSIAEALFEAGTPITSATEGLVTAGAEIEASGTTWYAIWAKKE